MRSESEIRWVRVRNNVAQAVKYSDWHAIIPGYGSLDIPPGTACGVSLTGSTQFEPHSGIRHKDGKIHDRCMALAEAWVAGIDPEPGPWTPDPEPPELAPPG
ncbi:MAG TPA: hypothetical protein VFX15_02735 [Actinomycetes bacterium]|nr:hypothetical protein [Actinomycetes bacterium]